MKYRETPVIKVRDFSVFPYLNRGDAENGVDVAQNHFEERFEVKSYRGGYILASKKRILDARGFVVGSNSLLERGVEAFQDIIRESRVN